MNSGIRCGIQAGWVVTWWQRTRTYEGYEQFNSEMLDVQAADRCDPRSQHENSQSPERGLFDELCEHDDPPSSRPR
ncbi:hypothetical protein RB195_017879 [Necator americanus]|uniref:Uncharacterized protein n=1 Tax=Necator americanus TaxID=51031 RepID=A0ABR1C9L7_NECAM